MDFYYRPEYGDTGFPLSFQRHPKGTKLQASAKLLKSRRTGRRWGKKVIFLFASNCDLDRSWRPYPKICYIKSVLSILSVISIIDLCNWHDWENQLGTEREFTDKNIHVKEKKVIDNRSFLVSIISSGWLKCLWTNRRRELKQIRLSDKATHGPLGKRITNSQWTAL